MVQEDVWKEISVEFENIAWEQINSIESDHLLFLLLTIPLPGHDDKSLINVSLEQRRTTFLNSDRITNVMKHIYGAGFLMPHDDLQSEDRSFSELLQSLVFRPFEFYFSVQGMIRCVFIFSNTQYLLTYYLICNIYYSRLSFYQWHFIYDVFIPCLSIRLF